ncbi:beta-ketoacyl synthase chain length factor [Bacillus sp. NP157]|nr:beta-ketoacyl synthase chain length factor [Bacillus sp. NP157]
MLEAADDACRRWAGQPPELLSVFSTHSRDADAVDRMMDTLSTAPRNLSPLTFIRTLTVSVAGSWTQRAGNHRATTTVTAGEASFGVGLLEAAVLTVAEARPVLYVFCDIPLPASLRALRPESTPLAAAMVISPERKGPCRRLNLEFGRGRDGPDATAEEVLHALRAPTGTRGRGLSVPTAPHTQFLLHIDAPLPQVSRP